jgi:prefoldin alpha subunit
MVKKPAEIDKAAMEQELQKKYMELQALKQHVGTIVQQKQLIDERQMELRNTIEALKNLDSIKNGEEIWSSLGSSTFVKSAINDITNVLVAVGAGVVLAEKVDKAVAILESRMADLDVLSQDVVKQAEAYIERIGKLEPEVEQLAEELQ